jgi:signal transduction histidine kinase
MAQKLHGQYELYHANNFNKAVSFFKKYLEYSMRLDNQTHIAIAYNKIGIAYDSLKDYNKAIDAFKHSYDICIREQIIDYGYKSALQLSTLFEKTGNYQKAYYFSSAAYSLKDKLDTESKLRELNLLEAKYQASRKEKQIADLRLVNAEHAVTESRQKQSLSNTRLMIAVLTIISLVILFIVYRYYHKKQLKEIEIRNKISRDLHDDIGATLSSIKIYGELANTVLDDKPAESKAMIGKITEQSKDLMQRMGDVIWSMKPAAETNNSFTARVRNCSSELLAPKDISCEIDIDESMCSKISNPITRKHLLLIVKEALNNIAKYSAATEVRINFKQENDKLVLLISDNGKGFSNPDNMSGNGLGNMRQRCEQCHGTFKIDSIPGKGVTVTAEFPIAIFSNTG